MKYEGNDKHKKPWQRGRKGSLCPKDIELDDAETMLEQSVLEGEKRYATREGKAFCAQSRQDPAGDGEIWHGYPVGWKEVPEKLRQTWKSDGLVRRRQIKKFWDNHEGN